MNKRLIAIGDIHGCYSTFTELLRKVEYNSSHDKLIFLGDYIDRGYESFEVVTAVKGLQRSHPDDVICIRGNHEQMVLDWYDCVSNDWEFNGNTPTIYSYESHNTTVARDLAWFELLPFYHIENDIIFCHAGLAHPCLADCSSDSLIWSRSWIFEDDRPRERRVVFGHTPLKTKEVYLSASGDLCIDSGCVYKGKLSALVIEPDGSEQIVSVPYIE